MASAGGGRSSPAEEKQDAFPVYKALKKTNANIIKEIRLTMEPIASDGGIGSQ
jgi:hypothetical protein